jgi:tRNA(Ile2)-agmatinylcytidine synthase
MNFNLHIGIDDTDSTSRGCTTYIAALLVEELNKRGVKFIDYPNLVRLNPNVPWKTRGNGAVCLRISCSKGDYEDLKELVIDCVEKNADKEFKGTDPGIVFLRGSVSTACKKFSEEAICGLVAKKDALKIIKEHHGEAVAFKTGRGIIGALAAIGEQLEGDHTFEVIAYRTLENIGKPRRVNLKSVLKMDDKTKPETFNNYDPETGRILITPRGLDPILFGIRGESPEIVSSAMKMVEVDEKIERWVIFRTNHGTDSHLRKIYKINEIRPFTPVIVEGEVSHPPHTITGGHVFFKLKDKSGEIECAAYEPTGSFRDIIRLLITGDLIKVYGGVRPASSVHPYTINLEKIEVLNLKEKIELKNPTCIKCGKRMSSMGFNKGYRCKKCGYRNNKGKKVEVFIPRKIKLGLYIPPPRAHRHLTKPFIRYGNEKYGKPLLLVNSWHKP